MMSGTCGVGPSASTTISSATGMPARSKSSNPGSICLPAGLPDERAARSAEGALRTSRSLPSVVLCGSDPAPLLRSDGSFLDAGRVGGATVGCLSAGAAGETTGSMPSSRSMSERVASWERRAVGIYAASISVILAWRLFLRLIAASTVKDGFACKARSSAAKAWR